MEKNQKMPGDTSQTTAGRDALKMLFATIQTVYPHFLKDQNEGDVKRMWFAHIGEMSPELIEKAAVIMVDRHPTFPPTIGEFKALMKELNVAKPQLEYKAPVGITYKPTSKAEAWRATQVAYSQRFVGAMPKYLSAYFGDFDCAAVASVCPMPADLADITGNRKRVAKQNLRNHEESWATLNRIFNEEWSLSGAASD